MKKSRILLTLEILPQVLHVFQTIDEINQILGNNKFHYVNSPSMYNTHNIDRPPKYCLCSKLTECLTSHIN